MFLLLQNHCGRDGVKIEVIMAAPETVIVIVIKIIQKQTNRKEIPLCSHLLAQIQQWKKQNNVSNLFKVKKKTLEPRQ